MESTLHGANEQIPPSLFSTTEFILSLSKDICSAFTEGCRSSIIPSLQLREGTVDDNNIYHLIKYICYEKDVDSRKEPVYEDNPLIELFERIRYLEERDPDSSDVEEIRDVLYKVSLKSNNESLLAYLTEYDNYVLSIKDRIQQYKDKIERVGTKLNLSSQHILEEEMERKEKELRSLEIQISKLRMKKY